VIEQLTITGGAVPYDEAAGNLTHPQAEALNLIRANGYCTTGEGGWDALRGLVAKGIIRHAKRGRWVLRDETRRFP
jgi:hypothetical protein